MNRNFKVVFSKARGALMVVNEATSSVQAKGTKTVIAAAVAALSLGAGVASAASQTFKDVTLGAGDVLTVTTETDANKYAVTGEIKGSVDGKDEAQTFTKDDTFGADASIKLDGGKLVLQNTEAFDVAVTAGSTGDIVVEAVDTTGNTYGKLASGTYDKDLNIDLKTFNAKTGGTAGDAKVEVTGALTLKSGALTIGASDKSEGSAVLGTATLKATEALALGVQDELYKDGEVETAGSVYDITNNGQNAVVEGSTVTYNKGTVTNSGDLTIQSTNGLVKITDQVGFANTGTISIEAASGNVEFGADYDTAANQGGQVFFKVADANTIKLSGAVAADTVKVGEKVKDEKNQIVFDGNTEISGDASLSAKTLTLSGKTLTVQANTLDDTASLTAEATTVDAAGSKIAVNGYAAANLGAITIADASTAAGLTLTVDSTASASAKSLTIKAAGTNPTTNAGTFALSGKLGIETLDNAAGGTVTIGDSGKIGALTLTSGASVNNGTIAFANASTDASTDSLVIAKDAALTNKGTLGSDVANGAIEVAGTLTNVNTPAGTNPVTPAVTGTITTKTLTVKDGGTVVADIDAAGTVYGVAETTLEAGSTFKTALNSNVAATPATGAAKDELTLVKTFNLNGGTLADADGNAVANYELGDSGVLNVNADQEFKAVKVNGTDAEFNIGTEDAAVVTVADLELASGSAVVNNESTLTVGKLTTATGQTLTVNDGTLNASLTAIGLTNTLAAGTGDAYGKVEANTIGLGVDGVFALSGFTDGQELTAANITTLKGKMANGFKGLVDLGNVAIKDLDTSKSIKFSELAALKGFTTTALKSATIDGEGKAVTIDTNSATYGKFEKTDSLTVDGVKLTLTGSGDLVTKVVNNAATLADVTLENEGVLAVTGQNAVIGNVTADSSSKGFFEVEQGGSLTVKGNVDVTELAVGADSSMTIDASKTDVPYTVKTGYLEVEQGGVFTAEAATVELTNTGAAGDESAGSIAGTAKVKSIKASGNGNFFVAGTLDVTDILEMGTGTLYVGDANRSAGTLTVGTLKSGTVNVSADWAKNEGVSIASFKTLELGTAVQAEKKAVVTIGADAYTADAVKALTGFTIAESPVSGDKAVDAKVSGTVNNAIVVDASDIIKGVVSAGAANQAGNYIGQNNLLVIDALTADTTGERAVFGNSLTLAQGSVLYLDNAANGQAIKMSATDFNADGANVVYEGDLLLNVDRKANTNLLVVGIEDKADVVNALGDVAGLDAIYGMYEKGENVGNANAKFFRDLMSSQTSSAYDKTTGEWNYQTIRTTLNDVAAIGATTGAQAVTMDAVNQMADTVAARTSILTQRAQGVNVWVDVNGGRFEGKKVMDGAGYSSDIYAGTLGADYQFANGAVLGAALTIGTADTDSEGTTAKTSMDSDLVGFSVYGSKTFADIWNVAGDIGYLQASNDVTESGYGFGDFSEDVNAFTLGVRGEVLTKAGSVNIVPHLGLRYTRLSTDSFKAGFNTEIDDQNIFQMPVGVTVSADFETSGWTIAPKFDLSVVPTFGDKDADLKLGISGVSASDDLSVRVIDSNPVQATLGVSATNGAWGFGLNYKLGVGSDDRMNNSFNANVRYAF